MSIHRRAALIAAASALVSSPGLADSPWLVWQAAIAGPGSDYAFGVTVDGDDDVIVTGAFSETITLGGQDFVSSGGTDVVVAKFTTTGEHVWSFGFGDGPDELGFAVSATPDRGVVVVGTMRSGVDFGGGALPFAGGTDLFVVKLDSDGNHVWSRGIGGTAWETPRAVATTDAGEVYVGGNFFGTTELGGDPVASASHDAFLLKLDANGTYLWSETFGGGSVDIVHDLDVAPGGDVVVVGQFAETIDLGLGPITSASGLDIFLATFTSEGNVAWNHGYGTVGNDYGYGVAVDPFGNVAITGSTKAGSDFGGGELAHGGYFLATYDSGGGFRWVRNAVNGVGRGVAYDADGNVCFTGSTRGPVDLGDGPEGDYHYVVTAKYDDAGNYVWSDNFFGWESFSDRPDMGRRTAATSQGLFVVVGIGETGLPRGGFNNGFIKCLMDLPTVPVLVSASGSRWLVDHVEVAWQLAPTLGDVEFRVYRAQGMAVPEIVADPSITQRGGSFRFDDYEAGRGTLVRHIVEIYEDGDLATSFETVTQTPGSTSRLGQNVPNPFNPATTIPFTLDAARPITLRIFDASGALVRTLVRATLPAGDHAVGWNGRDDLGLPAASGVYHVRLELGNQVMTRQALLLK